MRIFNALSTKRSLDVVIFGATGFTGSHVVQEVSKLVTSGLGLGLGRHLRGGAKPFKWGIAGRSEHKLKQLVDKIHLQNGHNFSNVETIWCDVKDQNSLINMCKKTRVVINCTGPYLLYGEAVVKACIDCGTHHIDVSGEPLFLETIQLKYHQLAQQKKVYIIGSCGWDSIPCDLGVHFLKENFNGSLNSVESYLRIVSVGGAVANFATWESLVNGYAHRSHLSQLRKTLFSSLYKKYNWKFIVKRKSLFWENQLKSFCIPFVGSDRSVVYRSQLHNFTYNNERPSQIETYFLVKKFSTIMSMILIQIIFKVFSSIPSGRNLLLNYPQFFSAGIFNKGVKPSRKQLLETSFELLLVGKGWNENYVDPLFQPAHPPNKKVIAMVSGGDPGYLTTSTMVVQAAITLLEESNHLPQEYGVFTPSSAFAKTSLINRLDNNGIHFKLLNNSIE